MNSILDTISNLEGMRSIGTASLEQIEKAQYDLGVRFADDYIEYVHAYGAISARGVELTGVTTAARLDVVAVTKREREINQYMPKDMYVIENTAIDGIIAIQASDGKIYSITMNGKAEFLCNSLVEYIKNSDFSLEI